MKRIIAGVGLIAVLAIPIFAVAAPVDIVEFTGGQFTYDLNTSMFETGQNQTFAQSSLTGLNNAFGYGAAGSPTLSVTGVKAVGSPTVLGASVLQTFTGGSFVVKDGGTTVLAGDFGGNIFFSSSAQGSLLSSSGLTFTQVDTAILQIPSLASMVGGSHLSMTLAGTAQVLGGVLQSFDATGTGGFSATLVPEPLSLLLVGSAFVGLVVLRKRV